MRFQASASLPRARSSKLGDVANAPVEGVEWSASESRVDTVARRIWSVIAAAFCRRSEPLKSRRDEHRVARLRFCLPCPNLKTQCSGAALVAVLCTTSSEMKAHLADQDCVGQRGEEKRQGHWSRVQKFPRSEAVRKAEASMPTIVGQRPSRWRNIAERIECPSTRCSGGRGRLSRTRPIQCSNRVAARLRG
jgi:hypothetical protein